MDPPVQLSWLVPCGSEMSCPAEPFLISGHRSLSDINVVCSAVINLWKSTLKSYVIKYVGLFLGREGEGRVLQEVPVESIWGVRMWPQRSVGGVSVKPPTNQPFITKRRKIAYLVFQENSEQLVIKTEREVSEISRVMSERLRNRLEKVLTG